MVTVMKLYKADPKTGKENAWASGMVFVSPTIDGALYWLNHFIRNKSAYIVQFNVPNSTPAIYNETNVSWDSKRKRWYDNNEYGITEPIPLGDIPVNQIDDKGQIALFADYADIASTGEDVAYYDVTQKMIIPTGLIESNLVKINFYKMYLFVKGDEIISELNELVMYVLSLQKNWGDLDDLFKFTRTKFWRILDYIKEIDVQAQHILSLDGLTQPFIDQFTSDYDTFTTIIEPIKSIVSQIEDMSVQEYTQYTKEHKLDDTLLDIRDTLDDYLDGI